MDKKDKYKLEGHWIEHEGIVGDGLRMHISEWVPRVEKRKKIEKVKKAV